jgi:hypothetical protein
MTPRLSSEPQLRATAKPIHRAPGHDRVKRELVELSPAMWAWGGSDVLRTARSAVAHVGHMIRRDAPRRSADAKAKGPRDPDFGQGRGATPGAIPQGIESRRDSDGRPAGSRSKKGSPAVVLPPLVPPPDDALDEGEKGTGSQEGLGGFGDAQEATMQGQRKMTARRRLSEQQERLDRLMELGRVYRGWSRFQLADRLGRDPGHLVPPVGSVRLGFLRRLAEVLDWDLREVVDALQREDERSEHPVGSAAMDRRAEPEGAVRRAEQPEARGFHRGSPLAGEHLVAVDPLEAARGGTAWDDWKHPMSVESSLPGGVDAWARVDETRASEAKASEAKASEKGGGALLVNGTRAVRSAAGVRETCGGVRSRSGVERSGPQRAATGSDRRTNEKSAALAGPRPLRESGCETDGRAGAQTRVGATPLMSASKSHRVGRRFEELDRMALAAHREGRTEELAELVVALREAANGPTERAIAANREVGLWDRRGRYQLALEAAHRGLAEERADEIVRWMLQANLAHAYTTLGKLVEGEAIARAVREAIERRMPHFFRMEWPIDSPADFANRVRQPNRQPNRQPGSVRYRRELVRLCRRISENARSSRCTRLFPSCAGQRFCAGLSSSRRRVFDCSQRELATISGALVMRITCSRSPRSAEVRASSRLGHPGCSPNQGPNQGPNQAANWGTSQGPIQGPNHAPSQGPNRQPNQRPHHGPSRQLRRALSMRSGIRAKP